MRFREEIGESLTLKFAEAAGARRKEGKEILSLGLGEPDFDVPPALIAATTHVLQTQKSGYSSPLGIYPLREKIANQFKLDDHIPAGADNIMITPGAKQAIQLALMVLLEPKDEVIVINPSFVSFIPQIYIAEPEAVVRVVDLDKSDFSLSKDAVLNVVSDKTRVLIVNSPSNPTGTVFNEEELVWLFNLAVDKGFYIISDEVYKKLSFANNSPLSIGSLEETVTKVFTVNGYSKSHAITGWRFGFMSFPKEFSSKLLKLQQHINTNTCTFIQQAINDCFDMDMSFLADYNKALESRVQMVRKYLAKSNLTLVEPKAGFFAFINISKSNLDSNAFCAALIMQTGVAITPGIAFGEQWDDHVRLSYAVNPDVLEKGLAKIVEFSNNL